MTFARWRSHPRVRSIVEWGLLFVGLLLAIWAATRSNAAGPSILLVVLYVIAINFSAPVARAGAVVVPVVGLCSLFVVGYWPALLLAAIGVALAELAFPLWSPIWQRSSGPRQERWQRLGYSLTQLAALAAAGQAYLAVSPTPLSAGIDLNQLAPLLVLGVTYAGIYGVANALIWLLAGGSLNRLVWDYGLSILLASILSQPFAHFGSLIFRQFGLPAFAVYCLGMGAFAMAAGLSWQRNDAMAQQLRQFAALNAVGRSMRETLDFDAVLQRTFRQVHDLVPADRFFIALVTEGGEWERPLLAARGRIQPKESAGTHYTPDDFTAYVADNGRVLDLDPQNVHYAAQHDLKPPVPMPAYWLGVPLATGNRTIGAMVLQRSDQSQPFSSWSREVLVAIAGQASAAVENARLYNEVLRLYNLTDEALARRVEQLHALLDAVQEGVLMLDARGRVLLVNRQAADFLGLRAESLQGNELDVATAAPRLGYTEPAFRSLLTELADGPLPDSRSVTYATSSPVGPEPARRFIERTETTVLSGPTAVVSWLMVLRDVTEERELAEWRQDVTRMIVHDLRNPVTTLMSTLQRVEKHAEQPERLPALLASARRTGSSLLDMVDSLMDIHRLEAGRLVLDVEAMRLPPLIERVLAYMQPLADERGTVLLGPGELDVPSVWADAELMRRVLVNLLDNALKFTPAGGKVIVEAAPWDGPDAAHDRGVRCTITDTGPGIPADHRERIFDRYTRIDSGGTQVRGTGLGLTFCKLAIEAQGGAIWVEDAPDQGSRFIFTLPGPPIF
jgi:signal transduction histidine kinase